MLDKEPKLYFENVSYLIEKITYKSISTEEGKELTVKFLDTFKLGAISTNQIEVLVNRTLNFKPKSLYNLSIDVKLVLPLNQMEKKFPGSIEELEKYTLEHIEDIINRSNLMETVSLLIGQISSAYGQVPIITPPMFIAESR